MKLFEFQSPKKIINKYFLCIFILVICSLGYSVAYSASDYLNEDTCYDGGSCYIGVKNKAINKWACGIYDSSYNNNVVWNNSVSVGDELYIDAYTSFPGGKLWVYENGVCVRTVDAGSSDEHIYLAWTVSTTNLKFACSASAQARLGEQLSVTINAQGDTVPPTVSVSPSLIKVDGQVTITLKDNKSGVVGYYVSNSSTPPTGGESGWIPIVSSTSTTKKYVATKEGVYYVYAKDVVNNISSVASFEAGFSPTVPRPEDYAVKESGDAFFIGVPSKGTAPFTYQWYRNTTNSTSGGTEIIGATNSTLSFKAKEADNNTYYYCKVTNRFGNGTSSPARLTVYYSPKLNDIEDATLKNSETKTYTVSFSKEGNTNSYIYQWFRSNTSDTNVAGARIVGATSNIYTVSPTANFVEWYYCEASNVLPDGTVLYTTSTNRARITSDVSKPVVSIGAITGEKYINKSATTSIKFSVTESGQGYTENGTNFTGDDFRIYVNNTLQSSANCSLAYNNSVDNVHNYTLTLKNVAGNGALAILVPEGSVKDTLLNSNEETRFETEIIVDNVSPTISEDTVVSGANGKYINKNGELQVRLQVSESVGIEKEEFTAEDIMVKVGSITIPANRTLRYESSRNGVAYYLLTLSNLTSDGTLSIEIPSNRIKDWANNGNTGTTISIIKSGASIVVDNTNPVLSNIKAELNNYGSGVLYPTALGSWQENWTNTDIYITLTASDDKEIDYYASSNNSRASFSTLGTNKEIISSEFDGDMYYRVYDMAGNFVEGSINIKLDKTAPNATPIGIYELRVGGADYIYKPFEPTNKSIYIKGLTCSDAGSIMSGVESGSIGTTQTSNYITIDNNNYCTYYIVNYYASKETKNVLLDSKKYKIGDTAEPLVSSGYYEVQSVTTDNAGNSTVSEWFPIYIDKHADNTIKITNLLDIGSGIRTLKINVYSGTTTAGQKVIDEIVVENPYKEYVTTVRLGKGVYTVEAVLEDNVGLKTTYTKTITNNF